ncbi:DUF5305 domain-containing protein [Haloarchaeobius sp. DT45]|uniref:DUF5305 domain-containing protein n=1 Tax=Haloarchaeobius sp. DT45 TaxID=3446116 RepID=UPI003F6AA940
MTGATTRLRRFVDDNVALVAVVLVGCTLLGGWLVYGAYVDQSATTRVEQREAWATTGWYDHTATVTEENAVYPTGTTLSNRSVYFEQVSPRLDGQALFSYRARERGELAGTMSLELVFRGVEDRSGEESPTVLWEKRRPLSNYSFDSLAPGERVRVPFTMNASAVGARAENYSEALGSPGEPRVHVETTVTVHGTVNGERVERTRTYRLPVSFQSESYAIPTDTRQTDEFEESYRVTVPTDSSGIEKLAGPLVLGGAGGGLLTLALGRRRGAFTVSETARERLDFDAERAEFDEWISPIRLPDDAFDRPEAEAESLQALVDFAIDTDNGVVEAPDEDAFYVVHGDYLYSYRPPVRDERDSPVLADDTAVETTESADDSVDDSDWEDPLAPAAEEEDEDAGLWGEPPDQLD